MPVFTITVQKVHCLSPDCLNFFYNKISSAKFCLFLTKKSQKSSKNELFEQKILDRKKVSKSSRMLAADRKSSKIELFLKKIPLA